MEIKIYKRLMEVIKDNLSGLDSSAYFFMTFTKSGVVIKKAIASKTVLSMRVYGSGVSDPNDHVFSAGTIMDISPADGMVSLDDKEYVFAPAVLNSFKKKLMAIAANNIDEVLTVKFEGVEELESGKGHMIKALTIASKKSSFTIPGVDLQVDVDFLNNVYSNGIAAGFLTSNDMVKTVLTMAMPDDNLDGIRKSAAAYDDAKFLIRYKKGRADVMVSQPKSRPAWKVQLKDTVVSVEDDSDEELKLVVPTIFLDEIGSGPLRLTKMHLNFQLVHAVGGKLSVTNLQQQ